jgi:hypothetical protein
LFWWLRDARFIQAAVGRILILSTIFNCRVSVEKAAGQRSRVSLQGKSLAGFFAFLAETRRKAKPNTPLGFIKRLLFAGPSLQSELR